MRKLVLAAGLLLAACVSAPNYLAEYCANTQPAARALLRERLGLAPGQEMVCPGQPLVVPPVPQSSAVSS